MAIDAVLVGARGVGAGNTATTTSGTTAASGSTFVIAASFDAGYGSITVKGDNKGNTYTAQGTPVADTIGGAYQLFVCENGAGGASHTATFTTSNNSYPVVHLIEITGAATASLDKTAQAKITGPTGGPWTLATGTLAQADEVVIALMGANHSASNPQVYSSSNTTILSQEQDVSQYWSSAVGALVVSSTASVSPSFTSSNSSYDVAMCLATFKQSSGGAAATPDRLLTIPPLRAAAR